MRLLFFFVFLSSVAFGQNRYNMEITNFNQIIENGFTSLLIFNESKKPVNGTIYWESEKGLMGKEGPLLMEMSFKDGVAHGICKSWYENGKVMGIGKFKEGKEHGKTSTWYENGQLWYENKYKNGQKQGYFKAWHLTGEILYKKKYKNNLLIKQKCWNALGNEIECE